MGYYEINEVQDGLFTGAPNQTRADRWIAPFSLGHACKTCEIRRPGADPLRHRRQRERSRSRSEGSSCGETGPIAFSPLLRHMTFANCECVVCGDPVWGCCQGGAVLFVCDSICE